MNGFLCVNKPSGITSFDALQILLQEILGGKRPEKRVKIGHAGTLDPLADGVLVVALNRATKLISYVQDQPKTYVATFQLGVESDSEDVETELRFLDAPPQLGEEDILRILPEFTGEISQMPPLYSALKLNGKRAYDLARKGREVQLAPRMIEIRALELLEYRYPFLKLEIVCGSGTYVRSLGRDIARRLGTEAVMTALTRTAVGVFRLEDAIRIPVTYEKFAKMRQAKPTENAEYAAHRDWSPTVERPHCGEFLRPMRDAVPGWPAVKYDSENQKRLKNGIPVTLPEDEIPIDAVGKAEFIALSAESGELLALLRRGKEGGFRSLVNFVNAAQQ